MTNPKPCQRGARGRRARGAPQRRQRAKGCRPKQATGEPALVLPSAAPRAAPPRARAPPRDAPPRRGARQPPTQCAPRREFSRHARVRGGKGAVSPCRPVPVHLLRRLTRQELASASSPAQGAREGWGVGAKGQCSHACTLLRGESPHVCLGGADTAARAPLCSTANWVTCTKSKCFGGRGAARRTRARRPRAPRRRPRATWGPTATRARQGGGRRGRRGCAGPRGARRARGHRLRGWRRRRRMATTATARGPSSRRTSWRGWQLRRSTRGRPGVGVTRASGQRYVKGPLPRKYESARHGTRFPALHSSLPIQISPSPFPSPPAFGCLSFCVLRCNRRHGRASASRGCPPITNEPNPPHRVFTKYTPPSP